MGPYSMEAWLQNISYTALLPFTGDKKAERNVAYVMIMKKSLFTIELTSAKLMELAGPLGRYLGVGWASLGCTEGPAFLSLSIAAESERE